MLQQNNHRARHAIHTLTRNVRTQPRYKTSFNFAPHTPPGLGLATPRQLVEYLDEYIVGQAHAKKVLSVAVFNHYNRVFANIQQSQPQLELEASHEDPHSGVQSAMIRPLRSPFPSVSLPQHPTLEKSNVLVIGPTGSGKTLLAKTLARVLNVPFSVSDATSFTQAGYVGEDVEAAIHRLLQDAQWDPYRASMGIVYIDEIDKIARKSGSGMESSRDVSGEGVQQALLRMMEGSVVSVQAKGGNAEPPPPPDGQGRSRDGHRAPHVSAAPKPDLYNIDTSNVLFIFSGAFVGLDNIVRQRVSKGHSIGFSSPSSSSSDSPFFFTPNHHKASENILESVDPAGKFISLLRHNVLIAIVDLVKYGFIPEFISRLPSMTSLAPLTIPDLRKILTGVKGSLLSQYKALFEYSNVEIRFTSAALDEICQRAYDRGGGARGLRGIMESLLLEPMYEVPGSDVQGVLITERVVKGEIPSQYWRKNDGSLVTFWEAWALEESAYYRNKASGAV
ncbi:hypothetical protein D9757_000271 [Collybiopsis confluens]|uniref:ClpX ATPase regulatory subunit n=1 Tax=Collybiopsis confluens TaxID=2823264 RepID=A0A8H5I211_9AGAR|nr:hypothetical protein D9757_000271 [Collybiopsis confluens]